MVIDERAAETWDRELEELFLRTGHRFGRIEPRRRMRDYVRGLLGPVGCKNSWVRHEAPVRREARGIEGGAKPPRRAVAAAR